MNTIIISAFPCCGRTYLSEHPDDISLNIGCGENKYTICKIGASDYDVDANWLYSYVNTVEEMIGHVDVILISQRAEVLSELNARKIRYVSVVPENRKWIDSAERQITKQIWFGRMVLKAIDDDDRCFCEQIEDLSNDYEIITSDEYLQKYRPAKIYHLSTGYLTDIMPHLLVIKDRPDNEVAMTAQMLSNRT